MNSEMENKKYYQEAFHEVHAPKALTGKVMDMTRREKTGYTFVKKFAMTAAALATLFVGSNGVAYAATGSTWVNDIIVYLNGTECDVDVERTVDEDGNINYSITTEVQDGAAVYVTATSTEEDAPGEIYIDVMDADTAPEVIEVNGVTYFTYGDLAIDITEDLKDGEASGTFEKDGVTQQYIVTGSAGEWSVQIEK
ncbi:MAG: hypothetical protein IJ326_03030 [Lachnospiraceae bacterium]|nr:hypothetical protein [Lachnospiraceae bacterium]